MFPLRGDRLFSALITSSALFAVAIVGLIFLFLSLESGAALADIGPVRFLNDPSWTPAEDEAVGFFELTPMLMGTLWATLGAVILATPLGIGSALFCQFYAPPMLAAWYRRMIGLLAGIPSVVYGFWGLVTLVPLIASYKPPGASLLAGILILAVMILPTIALNADAALAATPSSYSEAAVALGLSRQTTIFRILIPAARGGLATGILLGAGRALGETMAVLMVCGNVVRHPQSIFDPVRTLSANIALEMAYAMGSHRGALFVCGLVLLFLIALMVMLARSVASEAIHE